MENNDTLTLINLRVSVEEIFVVVSTNAEQCDEIVFYKIVDGDKVKISRGSGSNEDRRACMLGLMVVLAITSWLVVLSS